MNEERRPEEGQVQRAEESSQRGHVLGSPAAKHHGYESKKHGPVRTGALGCPCTGTPWTCPTSGNTYAGFYCPGVIDQRRSDSRTVEVTDSNRLGVIVYDALIGNVDVVRILHSTWPGNTPDWRRYILTKAFRLAMAGSGWDLKRDTH
jgi:hypothetical protein